MSSVSKPLWTTGKKILGNILPLIISLPFAIVALILLAKDSQSSNGLAWAVMFPLAGWLSVNLLGLFGNSDLKKELGKRYFLDRLYDDSEKFFVGYARPGFKGLLDPHEDIAFLVLHPDRLEVFGSARVIQFSKESIKLIRYRMNPHSWLLLGRWISIEGEQGKQKLRLLIEPRDHSILLQNLRLSTKIKQRLETWLRQPAPTPVPISAAVLDSDQKAREV